MRAALSSSPFNVLKTPLARGSLLPLSSQLMPASTLHIVSTQPETDLINYAMTPFRWEKHPLSVATRGRIDNPKKKKTTAFMYITRRSGADCGWWVVRQFMLHIIVNSVIVMSITHKCDSICSV